MLRVVKGLGKFYYIDCKSEIPQLADMQRDLNKRRNRFFKGLTAAWNADNDTKFHKARDNGITVLKERYSWAGLKSKR